MFRSYPVCPIKTSSLEGLEFIRFHEILNKFTFRRSILFHTFTFELLLLTVVLQPVIIMYLKKSRSFQKKSRISSTAYLPPQRTIQQECELEYLNRLSSGCLELLCCQCAEAKTEFCFFVLRAAVNLLPKRLFSHKINKIHSYDLHKNSHAVILRISPQICNNVCQCNPYTRI